MALDFISHRIRRSLVRAPSWLMNLYAATFSFSAYFCMYAFRKPFTAGTFEGNLPWFSDVSQKTVFVISQIIGYAASKYLGARVVSEVPPERRALFIIGLISCGWVALLGFAIGEPLVQVVCLFLNGLSLGMIWGLVVGFLEGRRTSEFLLAGLSCSFIVASGAVKDVGRFLMREIHIHETWMPFATAAIFFPALVVSVFFLAQVPRPTFEDERARSVRTPMGRPERRAFLRDNWLPLSLLLPFYFFLTAFRDYRDNYGVEIFSELGYQSQRALFTSIELPVALGVLVVLALLALVRKNSTALLLLFVVMTSGMLVLGLANHLLQGGLISGATWMLLLGLGSYLAYVPFGSMLFERLFAHTRAAGTAVFGIYLADALGYTGSVGVQIYADFVSHQGGRLKFFLALTNALSIGGAVLLLVSGALLLSPRQKTASKKREQA